MRLGRPDAGHRMVRRVAAQWAAGLSPEHYDRVYIVLAMQRSGHHAVVNQLCYQIGRVLHLNHCALAPLWGIYPSNGRYRTYDDGRVFDSGPNSVRAFRKQIRSVRRRYDNVLYSFENPRCGPDYVRQAPTHRQAVTICTVRDPFNWIASTLKFGEGVASRLPQRIPLWKAQVEQCLRPETYPGGRFVDINYDRWVTDAAYAPAICERLGLPYTEAGRDEVNWGSSFDGRRFHGNGSAMAVMDRWRAYEQDSQYRGFFERDPDLARLSEQYFQFNPLSGAS